ncbi:probable ethanolamin permease [Plesiocystis pacifica SIR-1]|uniref:Probable ethanolamin permease n=1 Tax=Plesiocystis pacifica SIR-1 TaxID=391625 RepID=A6GHE1_9BACT|nr:ethanolamine permease [Plesiocystis pacifica]EDM74705.1 probable ethanolamin permease [Plesiocystis pacifica SIR-1]
MSDAADASTTDEGAGSKGLSKSLGPVMIWGLGVGYVISGEYFGWNLGLAEGGPYGMLVATGIVSVMYLAFVLSYAELSCAIPRAGGAFVYADRALGRDLGFLAGVAQLVEFLFAPPAIAFAIGAYFQNYDVGVAPEVVAVLAFIVFVAINIRGVSVSAMFELCVTVLAVIELLIFAGVALPKFSWSAFSTDPLPNGWGGIMPALPFAIWFYLAIEGVANVAEEARNPARDIPRAFVAAMLTLLALALLTFFAAIGVAGWEAIVIDPSTGEASDSPLPLALSHVVGADHGLFHLLVTVGLLGLIASFHGILLVAGRAVFEFGRVGYLPAVLGRTWERYQTPAPGLIAAMLVGFVALATGKTGEIITLAVFGALSLYILSMASLFVLRRKEPELERPYRAPGYPVVPAVALVLAVGCFAALVYYNLALFGVFAAVVGVSYGLFKVFGPKPE